METDMVLGFTFLVLGAICGGSFGLPSKFAGKDTPWETLWGPFFFMVTILIPLSLTLLVERDILPTCSTAGITAVAGPLIFGLLWGLGSMTLGLSFAFIGLSLAYAINYGAQITFGSMMPMLIHTPGEAITTHGLVIILGVAVCLVGVVIVGRAGLLKTRSLEGAAVSETDERPTGILPGMLLAFASGILCACYAVGFSFGGEVMKVAQTAYGHPQWRSTFVVSALILWGGSISACSFCAYKLTANKTWNTLTRPGIGRILLIGFLMACLHDAAIVFSGLGMPKLGTLGVSVGYAVFMSLAIIVGNVNGFLTKEWKGASRQSITWILAGILVLVIGVCVLATGNAIKPKKTGTAAPEPVPAQSVAPR